MSVGTTDSVKFFDFLRGRSMNTFPGKHSILILDNCTIHHSQHIHSMEIVPFYLPPYSPDLNPIEELFSYMKYYLKQHEDLIESLPSPIPVIEAALDSVTSAHCTGWINRSNYDK